MSTVARDLHRPRGGSRAGVTVGRRRRRLAVVVAVSCGVVATGVTGTGLLLPAAAPTPGLRVAGAVVAVLAGGVLVRLDGAARATTALVTVSVAAAAVCLATLPASDVGHPWSAPPGGADQAGPGPDAGGGTGRDRVIEPGEPGGGAAPDAFVLPPGVGLEVRDGVVDVVLPDGVRITIGRADAAGGSRPPGPAGTLVIGGGGAGVPGSDPLGGDVALDGATFERGDGSRVTVGGGRLLEVPPPLEPGPDDPMAGVDALLALLLGCFAVLAFAPPFVRFGPGAGVTLVEPVPAGEGSSPRPAATVEEGLADVLRSMLADPEPRTAVIGAYARLLTALAEAGHPRRAEEGPHEHLWRALGPLGIRRQPVHRLAELFVRARFTPRPIVEEHRRTAVAALADALADLRLQASDVDEVAARVGAAPA